MSPAWLVKAPERPCRCGEEELADGNLLQHPFVARGPRLHTEENCGRIDSRALLPSKLRLRALLISADGCTQLLEVPDGQTAITRVAIRRMPPGFSPPDARAQLRALVQERTYVRGTRPAVTNSGVELHVFEEELR